MSDRPHLVGAEGSGVAFLDAPGVDAAALFDAIDEALATMPTGAILTVYTDDAAAADGGWCDERGVELLAIIDHHPAGTTLTLRSR